MAFELKGFRNIDTFEKWKEMAAAYDFKCVYCGLDFLESPLNYSLAEVEHFKPRSLKGEEEVPACRFCNKVKRNKEFASPEEAIEEVRRLREEYLKNFEFYELREKFRT